MRQHITRAYNSFEINVSAGTITKKSKEQRLCDEISYYQEIKGNSNEVYFPRLIGSSLDGGTHQMELEYYAYDNLGDYMVYQDFDPQFWLSVAEALSSTLQSFAGSKKQKDYSPYAEAMYIEKTERYYKELLKLPKFKEISEKEHLLFNGVKYLNFKHIWEDAKEQINTRLLPLEQMSIIHGDMCFSNILCGVNQKTNVCVLKFVDPRGHFGEDGIYGDPLYDYAKLVHSYHGGYEYIIYDQFQIEEDATLTEFGLSFANNNKEKIAEVFEGFHDQRSKLIEGLIYIGMCSRHYDSEDRQLAMYLTGVKTLNEALQQ